VARPARDVAPKLGSTYGPVSRRVVHRIGQVGLADIDDDLHYSSVVANGLRFRVAVDGPTDGRRLALCLHGFAELGWSWRNQLPMLASMGYRAWAPDLRGYGGSERPSSRDDYAIELLMHDIAGLIDASEAESVTLLGHGWGGVIAWYVAINTIRPIDRLIIMNAPHPAVAERGMRAPRQLRRSWPIALFQLPWLPERVLRRRGARAIARLFSKADGDRTPLPAAEVEPYLTAATTPGATKAMVDHYRALIRGGGAQRQAQLGFAPVRIPTLMIWGEADRWLAKELTYGTERHVMDLTIRYLPGVSHWVQQRAPETVNTMLRAFLEDHRVPFPDEIR